MPRDELSEELREFLIESFENLDRTEQDLVGIDVRADNHEVLAATFRTLHSIKGACGFFELAHLTTLAHEGESLLSVLRDEPALLDDLIVQVLLDLIDGVRRYLGVIEETGADGDNLETELCASLRAVRDNLTHPGGNAQPARGPTNVTEEVRLAPNIVVFAPTETAAEQAPPKPSANTSHVNLLDQAIRVDVSLLDRLVNLVGELVLVRNRTVQIDSVLGDQDLSAAVQRLNLITSELQEQVMQTRMQPMESLFAKLPRLVRDLARSLGKEVRLTTTGGDTELDRGILEAIRDPLVHLLRNSVDHGIEEAEERRRLGKDPTGQITISASHEGGSVIITIVDDGAGIDPAAIGERALRLGLVSSEALAALGDRERIELIFLPGFSTSEEVTSVSGRGVGMDVVRTNIERVSGSIEVTSESGRGTTIVLRIPLTLAIIPSLMLLVAGQRFALPQLSVVELLRLERESMADELAFVGETLFLRRHHQLLPVVDLGALLEVETRRSRSELDLVTIVVVHINGREFGLLVDRVVDTQEIVVKPLDSFIQSAQVYAGATILGDGSVAMILDLGGIASRSLLALEEMTMVDESIDEGPAADSETVLLVDGGDAGLVAIPIYEIERIEEIAANEVQLLAGRPVVPYRDDIVELVTVSELLGGSGELSRVGPLRFLVPSFGVTNRVVVIHEIVDITMIEGLRSGSTILGGKIVQVLSLAELLVAEMGGECERV
jgi:two-component system chemotaxis sensor kinase CheA